MGYQKQNFADGEVLSASQLNHIEDGITAFESSVTASLADRATKAELQAETIRAQAAEKANADGIAAVNQRMANLTHTAVEFGEVTGNGNILFNVAYTEKPLYQLLVDDGSTVLVTFQMQGNAYIGAALSGAGTTTKTLAIFYCCGAEDTDV